jgi:phosphinothricin acetyltransferase
VATVRAAVASDGQAVADIYNHYITDTIVTFEEEPVSAAEMSRRISEVQAVPLPWLIAEAEGAVAGYAYATKWRPRYGYRFSVEISVYLAADKSGHGLGTALYSRLFEELRERGIHSVIGGIALPNEVSVRLHEKFGFEKVAHFRENGIKFGRWIDVGYWQLIL